MLRFARRIAHGPKALRWQWNDHAICAGIMVGIWELFVVRGTLDNEKLPGIATGRIVGPSQFIHKAMFVVYATTPVSVHVPKWLWLANPCVAIAFYVFDKQVDSLENFLVL